MGLLKGNYALKDDVQASKEKIAADKVLEQEYYKAALQKLGGSIAFIMKDNTFLWTGDEGSPPADGAVKDEGGKNANLKNSPSGTEVSHDK